MEMSRRHLNVKWGIITADINLGIFIVKVALNTQECMKSFTGSLLCSTLKKTTKLIFAIYMLYSENPWLMSPSFFHMEPFQ